MKVANCLQMKKKTFFETNFRTVVVFGKKSQFRKKRALRSQNAQAESIHENEGTLWLYEKGALFGKGSFFFFPKSFFYWLQIAYNINNKSSLHTLSFICRLFPGGGYDPDDQNGLDLSRSNLIQVPLFQWNFKRFQCLKLNLKKNSDVFKMIAFTRSVNFNEPTEFRYRKLAGCLLTNSKKTTTCIHHIYITFVMIQLIRKWLIFSNLCFPNLGP